VFNKELLTYNLTSVGYMLALPTVTCGLKLRRRGDQSCFVLGYDLCVRDVYGSIVLSLTQPDKLVMTPKVELL